MGDRYLAKCEELKVHAIKCDVARVFASRLAVFDIVYLARPFKVDSAEAGVGAGLSSDAVRRRLEVLDMLLSPQ